MARVPASIYARRKVRNRRLSYIGAVLAICAVVIWIYYSRRPTSPLRGGSEEGTVENRVPEPIAEAVVETVVEAAAEEQEPEPEVEEAAQPGAGLGEVAAGPSSEPNETVGELIAEAMALLEERPAKIIEARDRLNELLPRGQTEQQRAFVKQELSELSGQWLFSRQIYPEDKLCGAYKVRVGDLLSTIGKQFKVPYGILMEINKIPQPEALQAGTTIKVINGPFHVRVYRSTFTMDLYLQNTYIRSFAVGLGKPGMETPTGRWRVKEGGKLIKPTWTDPISGKTYESDAPDYPLGSRWIGIEGIEGEAVGRTGFAIHGTKTPEQIGTADSQGCIRLHNGDAILMYNLLMSGVSLVEVVD